LIAVNVAVIGTDPGVDKTVVTAALVARLRARGTDARAIKPAQLGFPEDSDADYVRLVREDETPPSACEHTRNRWRPLLQHGGLTTLLITRRH
jgi:dethiobiotin synthetase